MSPRIGTVASYARIALAAALVAASVGCRRASAKTVKGPDLRLAADGGVTEVEVDCDGGATVTLAPGKDAVEVVESSYEGYAANPLSLGTRGKTAVVHQDGGGMFTDAHASFILRLPPGKDVRIHGVALELKGELAARAVKVEAKALRSAVSIEADSVAYKGAAVRLGAATLKAGSVAVEAEAFTDDGTLTVVGAEKVSIRSKALVVDLAAPKSKSVEIQGSAVSGKVAASAASALSVPPSVQVVRIP